MYIMTNHVHRFSWQCSQKVSFDVLSFTMLQTAFELVLLRSVIIFVKIKL